MTSKLPAFFISQLSTELGTSSQTVIYIPRLRKDGGMKRAVATALVALMLVTAGCNGFVDSGNSTDGGTPGTAPETTAPDTPAPTPTPTPTELEQEYIDSGNEFARVVGERLSERFATSLVDGTGNRDKTFQLTVQLAEGEPLYSGMMNTTQTVATTITFKTATNENAMADGTDGKVHTPHGVFVDVVDSDGNDVGSFAINPKKAFRYRVREIQPDELATSVVDTLELERDYTRGDQAPGWYLNRSNLVDFRVDFVEKLKSESDPAKTAFAKRIPTDNISIYPSTSEFRNEFEWDDDEYGQFYSSADAVHWATYYKTMNESWALAPSAITLYMHRPGEDDYRGRMPVEHVYWILDRQKDNANLSTYIDSEEREFIQDGE